MIQICKCNPEIKGATCKNCAEDGKGPGGRPTKFPFICHEQLKTVAELGWSDYQMYTFFKVSETTWFRWKQKFPEFRASISNWKKSATENIERAMYERAIGYSHPEDKIFRAAGEKKATIVKTVKHYPPDTKIGEFLLRVRDQKTYNIKTGVEVSGPEGKPIETINTNMTAKEAEQAYKKKIKEL